MLIDFTNESDVYIIDIRFTIKAIPRQNGVVRRGSIARNLLDKQFKTFKDLFCFCRRVEA